MSSSNMLIHDCSRVVVSGHQPDNSNAITLKIHTRTLDGHKDNFRITIFGLPDEQTDALIAALGKEPD